MCLFILSSCLCLIVRLFGIVRKIVVVIVHRRILSVDCFLVWILIIRFVFVIGLSEAVRSVFRTLCSFLTNKCCWCRWPQFFQSLFRIQDCLSNYSQLYCDACRKSVLSFVFSCLFFNGIRFYTSYSFLLLVIENSIKLVRFLCLCCISRIFDLFDLKYPRCNDLCGLCISFINSQVRTNTTFPIAAAIPYIFV